jgi:hypothetical protein
VEVDGDIEPFPTQAARKREVVPDSGKPATSRNDNDVSQITITADNLCGWRFDDVGEPSVRIPSAKGTDQRSGQHHVADQPQAY